MIKMFENHSANEQNSWDEFLSFQKNGEALEQATGTFEVTPEIGTTEKTKANLSVFSLRGGF